MKYRGREGHKEEKAGDIIKRTFAGTLGAIGGIFIGHLDNKISFG